MTADVVESPQVAILAANNQSRIVPDIEHGAVAGMAQFS
jgi:hypothetical protein